MVRFRIICPECNAVVLTQHRLAAVLELCPSCRHHVWDLQDALLADQVSQESGQVIGRTVKA